MDTAFNLTELTQKEKLGVWMKRSGMTYAVMAQRMGMTQWGAAKLFTRESIPTLRHNQLVELGIPFEFLPPAKDIPPGPKPGGKKRGERR